MFFQCRGAGERKCAQVLERAPHLWEPHEPTNRSAASVDAYATSVIRFGCGLLTLGILYLKYETKFILPLYCLHSELGLPCYPATGAGRRFEPEVSLPFCSTANGMLNISRTFASSNTR